MGNRGALFLIQMAAQHRGSIAAGLFLVTGLFLLGLGSLGVLLLLLVTLLGGILLFRLLLLLIL